MDEKQPESNKEPERPEGSTQRPLFGAMRGEIKWQDGWEGALSSEEADEFWEGSD